MGFLSVVSDYKECHHTTGVEVKNLCGSDWPFELMEEGPRGSLRISTPFHLGASLLQHTCEGSSP